MKWRRNTAESVFWLSVVVSVRLIAPLVFAPDNYSDDAYYNIVTRAFVALTIGVVNLIYLTVARRKADV